MPKPLGIQPMFDGLDAVVFKPKDGKDRPGLYLEECSYQAAKYAVEHWHYSGRMPSTVSLLVGVWESGRFIGSVLFGGGATPAIGSPFGLDQIYVAELVRVALNSHTNYVSKIVSYALKMLHRSQPIIRAVVSFADPSIGHMGIIYQATNWIYTGLSLQAGNTEFYVNGDWLHTRTLGKRYGTQSRAAIEFFLPNAPQRKAARCHRYVYPLDAAMRAQIEPLRKPYPKCVGSAVGGTVSFRETGDGSIPIPTLRESEGREVAPSGTHA